MLHMLFARVVNSLSTSNLPANVLYLYTPKKITFLFFVAGARKSHAYK